MGVIDWLLAGDPAIRWQVLRDLRTMPPPRRSRPSERGWSYEGLRARLLALEEALRVVGGGSA